MKDKNNNTGTQATGTQVTGTPQIEKQVYLTQLKAKSGASTKKQT